MLLSGRSGFKARWRFSQGFEPRPRPSPRHYHGRDRSLPVQDRPLPWLRHLRGRQGQRFGRHRMAALPHLSVRLFILQEAVHIVTGKYYACKIISKKCLAPILLLAARTRRLTRVGLPFDPARLMEGREHMVRNEIDVLKRVSQGHPSVSPWFLAKSGCTADAAAYLSTDRRARGLL